MAFRFTEKSRLYSNKDVGDQKPKNEMMVCYEYAFFSHAADPQNPINKIKTLGLMVITNQDPVFGSLK